MSVNTVYNTREELFGNLKNIINGKKGVEIGVFMGHSSLKVLQNWDGTLYMVDVWAKQGNEYDDMGNYVNHVNVYQSCTENIKGYEDRGIMIRATSKVASEIFTDNSLDFIHIDANHAYDFVKEDLKLWYPKLKSGGLFSGHDYLGIDWYKDALFAENGKDKHIYNAQGYLGRFGVNPAVDEFCIENDYNLNVTKEWFGTWWLIKK